jgi:shikimate dehydrogenase
MNPRVSSSRWELGLLGHPVGHSVSPVMHEAALEALGLQGRYVSHDVAPEKLEEALDWVRSGSVHGLNVTVPHKVHAASACERLVGHAASLGAVNTLRLAADGTLEGHNTDVSGLVEALSNLGARASWEGGVALVVGAGGAARAAVLAALSTGASTVRVMNRTAQRARDLCDALSPLAPGRIHPCPWGSDEHGAQLVLQATTMGMGGDGGGQQWNADVAWADQVLRCCPDGAQLVDLIYRPARTPWIEAAECRGLAATGGVEMLVQQAAHAFHLWTGRFPSIPVMRKAALDALAGGLEGSK